MLTDISQGATIAINGIRAEKRICSQENIRTKLESYFKKKIQTFKCVPCKKYDILITFEDGSFTTIQNKDGGGGRGWSVDRRNVEKYNDIQFIVLLNTVCLKNGNDKPEVIKLIATNSIHTCLLGEDPPQYFTHTISDKKTGTIISISICDKNTLIDFITNEQFDLVQPKRTCVHLSPSIYLQRKGGGKTDSRPDDIQMKLKLTNGIENTFCTL